LVPGLEYRAFHGPFPWVPDFEPLTPVTNGVSNGFDLTVRPRNDNLGLWYTGYLEVPADGTYSFYLVTDGRAFLRLHDAGVLDADYGYSAGTEISASIALQAGRHPIRLGYVRGAGGSPSLTLEWSGPGILRQAIPAASLLRTGSATNLPPTALNDTATTPRNAAVTLDVLANDAVGSGPGPLRILSVSAPGGGTAATNLSGQIVYTPAPGFLGEDAFSYTIWDGAAAATANVTVNVVFSDGLIWFPLNQTGGLVTTDAGGAYTANLTGFTNDPAQWIAGKWNRALQLNGAGNFLTISGFNGILGTSNRTCAAWVRTTATGMLPVIAWGPNSAGSKWTFLIQNGNVRLEVTSGYRQGSTLVNDGQWHHVACVFANDGTPNATDVQLYVDGVAETVFSASAAYAINTASSGPVKIGSDVQSRYFNGGLDEPRIYDNALSPAEVAALYSAGNQSAAAWHRRYYGNAPVDWNGRDRLGCPRLLDYAFGAQPWLTQPHQLSVRGELLGNRLRLFFPRRIAGTSEIIYTPQVTRDLLDWVTLPINQVGAAPLPEMPGFEEAVFQTDATIDQEKAQYVRVGVRLP
jgi:hypothetical protein